MTRYLLYSHDGQGLGHGFVAAEGTIGSVADTHYTVMGSTDPAQMVESADGIAAALHADQVNAVVLAPV